MRVCLFLVLAAIPLISANVDVDEYSCVKCLNTIDAIYSEGISSNSACEKFSFCSFDRKFHDIEFSLKKDSRSLCQSLNACPEVETTWTKAHLMESASDDIRVTKGYGSRGYDQIRISVISNTTISSNDVFSYSEPFKYRWTSNVLNTGVVSISPGQPTDYVINGKTISITIPIENEGVRGVIIADPCFQSQWVNCAYKDTFQTFTRTPEILNAIHNGHSDTHFWSILGDNFYDQSGAPTTSWFQTLSLATKTRLMATFPGNHDYWVTGSPGGWTIKDQQGNGYMQYYGQDTAAGLASNTPYDFSVNPDVNPSSSNNPSLDNFFSYYKIGNIAIFGYSGAYSYVDHLSRFEEACEWAVGANPEVILLLGHWNAAGDGCEADMAVPTVYDELRALPACINVASKFKYVVGHTHYNKVNEVDVGFMVAGQGMSGQGSYGVPVFDTTGGRFKIYYFSFAVNGIFDDEAYNNILGCIEAKGVSLCYDLASVWVDTSL